MNASYVIAECGRIEGATGEANARLIEAAPDMADLLRREPAEGHTYGWQQERRTVLKKAGLL